MPIFEYACTSCGDQFELLVRSGGTPQCPSCQSASLSKRLSTFATGGGGTHAHAGPCGSCGHPQGPGSCTLN